MKQDVHAKMCHLYRSRESSEIADYLVICLVSSLPEAEEERTFFPDGILVTCVL